MDTIPSRYYRRGKRIDGSYPCLQCPYGDNKTCAQCVFAVWNVEGILGGFSPSEAYLRSHAKDAAQSPLIQGIMKEKTPLERGMPNNDVLPRQPFNPLFPVPTYNSILQSLDKILKLRK